MKDDLTQIPKRIEELRDILEIPVEEMAGKLAMEPDEYLQYEKGEKDIPISLLYKIAAELGVDFTVLLTGESPRMDTQTVVRKGGGVKVDRYEGYSFSSLAYNYKGRMMEPMVVTIDPQEKEPALVVHSGQEFNYVLSGQVKVTVGKREHLLSEGDSIYFDPNVPHGQAAIGGRASFLTVIME